MNNEYIFSYLKNYVDSKYTVDVKNCDDDFSSIINQFLHKIKEDFPCNVDFGKLLMSVYIPDLYLRNGSKEKLFTKLVEVLVAEWSRRMNFKYDIITKKSGVEDVRITIGQKTIVVDSKTFRLGRSQGAPNVKDFLKLESVRHWIDNCRKDGYNAIGGMIVYTSLHEWKTQSEVYIQCSSKSTPTIMIPYKYLAYLLDNKENFDQRDLIKLWDFQELFPNPLPEKNNRALYWNQINPRVCEITNTKKGTLNLYINEYANPFISECVEFQRKHLSSEIEYIVSSTEQYVDTMDITKIKEEYIQYIKDTKTKPIKELLKHIDKHR